MFMYKINFKRSARLVETTEPDALFNLYCDEPDAVIDRTTTMRPPYFSYSYASEPSFEMCTSIVADDSPDLINSENVHYDKINALISKSSDTVCQKVCVSLPLMLLLRFVAFALAPKPMISAVRIALLPLPF